MNIQVASECSTEYTSGDGCQFNRWMLKHIPMHCGTARHVYHYRTKVESHISPTKMRAILFTSRFNLLNGAINWFYLMKYGASREFVWGLFWYLDFATTAYVRRWKRRDRIILPYLNDSFSFDSNQLGNPNANKASGPNVKHVRMICIYFILNLSIKLVYSCLKNNTYMCPINELAQNTIDIGNLD